MCDGASDFSGVKVGDKLWSVQLGECEVIGIGYSCGNRFIKCVGDKGVMAGYDCDGRRSTHDVNQSLFWSRPENIAPPRPKRKVVKTVEAWAVVSGSGLVRGICRRLVDAARLVVDGDDHGVRLTGTYDVEE